MLYTGPFDVSLLDLSSLTTVVLAGNNFTGSLPPFPGSLRDLDVSATTFTGALPCLANLTRMVFRNSRLGGLLPSAWAAIEW